MTNRDKNIFFVALFVLVNLYSSAQISSPISPTIDTLYLSSGSMTPTIDPNPGTNPFITDSARTFGRVTPNSDPGGPGSGGPGFGVTNDVAIPLDGGVTGLILAGAVIGLSRNKKEKRLL